MAFWASAAWGQEALGVDVETSWRLDLVVKALLHVGAYIFVLAVEKSNASWMAGSGCILCDALSHNSALPPVVCACKWGMVAACGLHRAVVAGGEARAPLRDAPESSMCVCVCVTPNHFSQINSVRYDTPLLQLCSHCVCVCVYLCMCAVCWRLVLFACYRKKNGRSLTRLDRSTAQAGQELLSGTGPASVRLTINSRRLSSNRRRVTAILQPQASGYHQ